MPDTVENQKSYPQPSSQKPRCGFPFAKIGVLFSLVTRAAVALVIDVMNTHDIKLARKLYEFLNPLESKTAIYQYWNWSAQLDRWSRDRHHLWGLQSQIDYRLVDEYGLVYLNSPLNKQNTHYQS